MEEKMTILEKTKAHKGKIIIAGVTVLSLVGVVLIAKNWDAISAYVINHLKRGAKTSDNLAYLITEATETAVTNNPSNVRVIDISRHIRNLPEGWNASPEKIDVAIKTGIKLNAHQTWVDNYSKMYA